MDDITLSSKDRAALITIISGVKRGLWTLKPAIDALPDRTRQKLPGAIWLGTWAVNLEDALDILGVER